MMTWSVWEPLTAALMLRLAGSGPYQILLSVATSVRHLAAMPVGDPICRYGPRVTASMALPEGKGEGPAVALPGLFRPVAGAFASEKSCLFKTRASCRACRYASKASSGCPFRSRICAFLASHFSLRLRGAMILSIRSRAAAQRLLSSSSSRILL